MLIDIFPESMHVNSLGLGSESDEKVREYAALNGFNIVSQDSDFNDLCLLKGFPPKIVWIRKGNCGTRQIEQILRYHLKDIQSLNDNADSEILTLF